MELLAYTSVVIANPSDDSADAPDPAPVVHVCLDAEEALVVDARAGLSPAQMVERNSLPSLGATLCPSVT